MVQMTKTPHALQVALLLISSSAMTWLSRNGPWDVVWFKMNAYIKHSATLIMPPPSRRTCSITISKLPFPQLFLSPCTTRLCVCVCVVSVCKVPCAPTCAVDGCSRNPLYYYYYYYYYMYVCLCQTLHTTQAVEECV